MLICTENKVTNVSEQTISSEIHSMLCLVKGCKPFDSIRNMRTDWSACGNQPLHPRSNLLLWKNWNNWSMEKISATWMNHDRSFVSFDSGSCFDYWAGKRPARILQESYSIPLHVSQKHMSEETRGSLQSWFQVFQKDCPIIFLVNSWNFPLIGCFVMSTRNAVSHLKHVMHSRDFCWSSLWEKRTEREKESNTGRRVILAVSVAVPEYQLLYLVLFSSNRFLKREREREEWDLKSIKSTITITLIIT